MSSTENDDPTIAADPWAAGGPHSTVRLPYAGGGESDTGDVAPRRSGWQRVRRFFTIGIVATVIAIVIVTIGIVAALPHLSNPFKAKTTDRTGPVLLLSIRDLARFEAASGNFQVIVDVQHDETYIPDFLYSERSLFVADGTVDAYVDFANIGAGDVVASADDKTATITLPAPAMEPPTIDPARSYVYSDSKGLVNHLQDLFSDDANKQQALYKLADQKIAQAAADSQLLAVAETNTRSMLIGFLKALGYTNVTVTFRAS
jgi:hypothetical protein